MNKYQREILNNYCPFFGKSPAHICQDDKTDIQKIV